MRPGSALGANALLVIVGLSALSIPRVVAASPGVSTSGSASPPSAATSTAQPPVPTVAGSQPWWTQVALAGMSVDAVWLDATGLHVTADGVAMTSSDRGRTLIPDPTAARPTPDGAVVRSGTDGWAVRDGHVLHATGSTALAPDPGSPGLGAAASLLAAPAALPGQVVAVSDGGTVYRRTASGSWESALLLLPEGLTRGAPRITSIAAFSQPLTTAIYLGTDGYGVFLTTNGGEDWLRGGPGLPDGVFALAADPAAAAVYAGTRNGLWVHVLRPQPQIPTYTGSDLTGRTVATAAITVGGCVVGVAMLAGVGVLRRRMLRD